MGKGRIVKCSFCKHPRRHYARGLCEACFRRLYMRTRYWKKKAERERRRQEIGE